MTAERLDPRKSHPAATLQRLREKFTENLANRNIILEAPDIRPGHIVLDAGFGEHFYMQLFSDRAKGSGRP